MQSDTRNSSPKRHPEDDRAYRKPVPPSNWPSIKLIYLPEGRHSQIPDERCLTYCSQTVAGRIQRKDPSCRTICVRRVFSHEVRNVLGFDRHRRAKADGTAKYPLPKEGQTPDPDPEDTLRKLLPGDTRYWEEGWYLWYTKGKWAGIEKIDLMHRNLGEQEWWYDHLDKRRQAWDNWQKERDPRGVGQPQTEMEFGEEPKRQHLPSRPIPNESSLSTLVRFPPQTIPLYQLIQNYLAPTSTLMGIVQESIADGTQERFAKKVWETAWTSEPYRLVSVVCSKMWTMWKDGPPDGKDGTGTSGI